MNMASNDYQDHDLDYQLDSVRRGDKRETPSSSSRRRMSYSRTSRPSVMHNGIHRRRNKRFSW